MVEEKHSARIIIYGMSWGGAETVTLAEELEKDGIPVLLTIQVDSISKIRQNDAVIPSNVAEAINFYQRHGLLRGQPNIRAADRAHTRIIGNLRFDYEDHPIKCDQYPWYLREVPHRHRMRSERLEAGGIADSFEIAPGNTGYLDRVTRSIKRFTWMALISGFWRPA